MALDDDDDDAVDYIWWVALDDDDDDDDGDDGDDDDDGGGGGGRGAGGIHHPSWLLMIHVYCMNIVWIAAKRLLGQMPFKIRFDPWHDPYDKNPVTFQ